MPVDGMELMSIMPRDVQLELVLGLIPSYDVSWDIEYIYEEAGEPMKVYNAPCHISGTVKSKWDFMAREFLGWREWGTPSVEYLSGLVDLMRRGCLREGDTTMWVDANQLLYWTSEHLSRVKKIVNIVMSLGFADVIRFNIWDHYGDAGEYEMVPQNLFNEHFGRYTLSNPHGIRIEYDLSSKPTSEEEWARVRVWDHLMQYDLDTERENQRWEHLYGPVVLPNILEDPMAINHLNDTKDPEQSNDGWGEDSYEGLGWH